MVILIPTHGRSRLLERTIDSVLTCSPPAGWQVRMMVVENGGCHGVEQVLRSKGTWLRPEYRYHEDGNKSAALNSVLDDLDDCLVVFFDDDVRVDPGILCAYSKATDGLHNGIFLGGGVLVDYEKAPPQWLLKHLPVSARGWRPAPIDYSGVVGQLAFLGCNWAAFSSDLRAVGGFDCRFGPGGTTGATGQERAMQIALTRHGLTPIYVSDATVWHYVPRSRCSVGWALQRTYRNGIRAGHDVETPIGAQRFGMVPLEMLKAATGDALRAAISFLHPNPERRYIGMSRLMMTLGRIKGIREKVRQAC